MGKTIAIIGVPMAFGQEHGGVDQAPAALRQAGLHEVLKAAGYDVFHAGDIGVKNDFKEIFDYKLRNLDAVIRVNEELAKLTDSVRGQGHFPLILGGDHSIAIGSIAGLARGNDNLGVVWLDAHGDLNTDDTTFSGNIHGMPLAAGLGYGHSDLVGLYGYGPKLKPKNTVIIGLRSLDPGETALIKKLGLKTYTTADIDDLGPDAVTKEVVTYLGGARGIHLSFDADVLDPLVAPGVGTPVAGGLHIDAALRMTASLAKSSLIKSFEIVEINPALDKGNMTVKAAIRLIECFFRHLPI